MTVFIRKVGFQWWWHVMSGSMSIAKGFAWTEKRARKKAAQAMLEGKPLPIPERWTVEDAKKVIDA